MCDRLTALQTEMRCRTQLIDIKHGENEEVYIATVGVHGEKNGW